MILNHQRESRQLRVNLQCKQQKMPEKVIAWLHDNGWHFYTFIGVGGARLMCAWDTREEDVRDFVADLEDAFRISHLSKSA